MGGVSVYRIGLTGGIATGKSTVAAMLRELGLKVIDADQAARQVVQSGEAAYRDLVSHFGADILLADGEIDRQRLGQIVFSDAVARQQVNDIVHPRVLLCMDRMVAMAADQGYQWPIVLDIPLLIECNLQHTVDEIWLAVVEPEIQLQRLMARNQLARSVALARINAQLPVCDKIQWATEIIDNSGSLADTRRQVEACLQSAVQRSRHFNQ